MKSALRAVAILCLITCGLAVPQAESQAQVSNTWSSAGQMTQGRTGAAAVRLFDGRIVITGGTDSSGVPQASAEAYDPSTGVFSALPAMNIPRANHAAIVLGSGDVLVTGGLTTGGGYSDTAEIYSVSKNQWTLLQASIGTGLAGQSMVLLSDGNVLIAGGASTTKVVGSIILFNHTDQTFTPIGTLQTPRTNAAAAGTPDGRVLIAGGADINGAPLSSTEIFTYSKSTMTGSIAAGPNLSSARVYATATTTYDGVAVIGGNNGQNDLGTAEIFSQWTNAFTVVSGGTPRSHHFAVLLPNNGSILAMGGTGGTAVDLLEPWANNKAGAFVSAAASLYNQNGGFSAPAGLGSALAGGGTGKNAGAAEIYHFPTVSTQNPEYAPGMPVQMSGSGFQPFETITLHIHLWVDQSTSDAPDATVTADASGSFTYNGYAPDSADVGARYHLTAIGETSGYQAQTIFGDSATYIIFTNTPLNQAVNTCGELSLSVGGGSTPYGTFYLYDSTTTGTFYSNANCTTAITSVTFTTNSSANIYYENTAASTPELMACSTNAGSEGACELAQAFGSAFLTSQTETITSAATKLAWSMVPGNGAPNQALSPQPAVVVEDSVGHTVSSSAAPIMLSLSTNPGGNLTCTGGLTMDANAGIAQFSGCSIDTAATTQYCLSASSSGLTSPTPTCFYVTNPANAANSTVTASTNPATNPVTVLDNGTAYATVTVTLKDSSGNPVAGKTVVLQGSAGTNSNIGNASGLSSSTGVVTFKVTDSHAETVTYTATDTTDGVLVTETAPVIFQGGTVSTTRSSVSAAPGSVTADGVSESIITVTLEDSSSNPVSGKTVTLAATACTTACNPTDGSSTITTVTGVTNSSGQAVFTVVDSTVQNVTYTATDLTDSIALTTHTVTVDFLTATGGTASTLTWSPTPVSPAAYNSTFTVTAVNGNTYTTGTPTPTIAYAVSGVCTISGTSVTMTAPSGNCVITATLGAYTYTPFHGTATKYNSVTITATVAAELATPATLTVTGAPASAVYNTTFTVGYSGGSGTGAVTFNTSGGCSNVSGGSLITMTSGTTACTITATQAADSNYSSQTSAPVTVTAEQATGTVTLSCPTNDVYNGQPQGCTSTTSPTSGLTVNYTYNGSSAEPSGEGSYTVVATISDPNYTGTATSTLVITPELVTVTAGSYTGVYNGNTVTIPACTYSGGTFYTNLSCTDSPATVGPGVGSGAITPVVTVINGDSASNYTITTAPGAWSITAAPITVTAGSYSGGYNGTAATIPACQVSGTYTGTVTCTDNPATVGPGIGSGTVAPVAAVGAGDSLSNYSISEVSGSWSITAAPVTVTAGSYSGVYDGNAHAPAACVVSGAYTGTLSCTDNPSTVGPNAGSGLISPVPAVGVGDSLSNYSITQVSGSYNITPAPVTITAGSYSGPYTGVAATIPACVVTGTSPATFTGTMTCTNNPASVGPAEGSGNVTPVPAVVSPDLLTNYTITSVDGTWSIGNITPTMSLVLDPGSSNPSPQGSPVYFDLNVNDQPAGSSTPCPTGTVQWYVNGTASGSPVTLPATCAGPIIFESSSLPNSATVSATYSGDSYYAANTQSNTVNVTVSTDTTSVTLAASATAINPSQADTFTATITPAAGVTPAGTVNFLDGTTVIDTETLSGTAPYTAVFTDSTLGAGAHSISAAYVPSGSDPAGTSSAIAVNVSSTLTAPVITWATPAPITYPTALSATQLNATSTVPGTFTYAPLSGYVPFAGPINLWVTFTPNDPSTYSTQTALVTLSDTQEAPTVSDWPTASAINYGETLASSTLDPVSAVVPGSASTPGSASVAGTFTWTTPTTLPATGTDQESVTFTPTDTNDYSPITSTISVKVNQATPTVVWPTANPISVGETLSASSFTGGSASATVNGSTVNVPGTFAWVQPTLAPTPANTYTESVTFTPTDTTDYAVVTGSVSIVVNNKGNPTVTVWPTATAITYGQPLSASTLSLTTAVVPTDASVAGTYAWTAPATIPLAGAAVSESVTFTPTDTTDYNTASQNITLVVSPATPTIATPPAASAITVGQLLSASTLTGGSATATYNGSTVTVPGTFAWASPGTAPTVGTDSESVIFTPTDGVDYSTVTFSINVVVNPKTNPTVTVWPTASPLTYGQALSASTLTPITAAVPGNASVAGTFAWTTPATIPGAGTDQESVTFTPTDTTDYNPVTQLISITVSKATPTVTVWPTASAISAGESLVSSTLTPVTAAVPGNASVPGTFAWTAPATIPTAGTDSESVTFTPTDAADYNTVTSTISVVVNNKVTPTVSVPPTATPITYGQTLASSTLSGGTAVAGTTPVAGVFTWTLSTITPGAGTPSESVTFTPTDTTDYNTTTTTIPVTVSKATPTVTTGPTAGNISLGQPLSASSLTGGTVTFNGNPVAGTWTWTAPTTVLTPAGTYTEGVTFTPTDTTDYTTVTSTASVTVNNLTTPTVTTWPTASDISYGQTLASSVLIGGSASVPGNFVWANPSLEPTVGTSQQSVIFEPQDTADYNTVTHTVAVTVLPAVGTGGYVVTVSTDDSGTAANCTPQSKAGTGTDRSCSLRDALLADASGGGEVSFDSTTFSAPTTITLSNGALPVPTAAVIVGPTTGSGASLANLVTIDGNNASTVFTVASGVTGASIANLNIQHGKGVAGGIQNAGTLTLTADTITNNTASGAGAGISNSGTLTLTGSTLSTNTAAGNGGGIDNTGTLTLTDDTISGNISSGSGGGIYNSATLAVSDSTISGNTAATTSGGGGIDNAGTAALTNTIVSGNSVSSNGDDFDGAAYTDNSGNVVGVVNGTAVSTTAISLAPLGSYGGPTQTMVPLPGSPAICAGVAAGIPSGLTTDQRGLPNTNSTYTGSACVDSGAVQTNYALSFTTQPAGGPEYSDFAAAVTLTESGSPFQPPVTIPLALTGPGNLTGGSEETVAGVATYTLDVDTPGTGDTLTANLTLNGGLVPAVAISATSNSFTITPTIPATVTLGGLSQTYTGSPISATATTNPTVPAGDVTFTYNGSSTAPTAPGSYTVVGTINPTSGYTGTATGTMVIAQAPTTTTISLSSASTTPGQSVTLTATVAPAAAGTTGPPTGTVNFYNGTTLLNSVPAPLSGGTATYTTTTLASGNYQITATYSGDTDFLASTTATPSPLVVGGLDFTLTANAPTSQTVSAGSTATYQLVVAPLYGTYPGTVTFTASGLPATASVTFNPSTIAANGGQQTVTMTVQTATASADASPSIGRKLAPLSFALFLIPFLGLGRLRRQGRRLSSLASVLLILGCTLVGGLMMTGCGGTIKNAAVQGFTITVTATSGTIQHTAPVTLQVQ